MSNLRLPVLLAAAAVSLVTGCVDGPYAHVNPNDSEFFGTMTLQSSSDTISPANPVVVVKVVTDPVVSGYEPDWVITQGTGVANRGHGIFELLSAPATPTPFEVSAVFQSRTISRTIIRAPAP